MRRGAVVLLALAAAACSGGGAATTTSTTEAATTTTVPAVDALVTIPVGPGGVEYGPDADGLVAGPSLITADPQGGLHLYDPVGHRILSFDSGTGSEIDLEASGIRGEITAMTSAEDHLVLVETLRNPSRQNAHRVGFDGAVLETITLPASYHDNAGLTAVFSLGGRIVVEYGAGSFYGAWTPDGGSFRTSPALSVDGVAVSARAPDLVIGDTTIDAAMEGRTGGLRYLGTLPDGTHVITREEVDDSGQIAAVLITVEWYTPDVEFAGSARIPDLERQAIARPPGVAVLPDGRAVALIAREEAVYVIELDRLEVRITGSESAA